MNGEELAAALARLPGWQQDEGSIRRIYEFASYADAIRFVNRVADLAEAANHHPDMLVGYGRVTVILRSHDVGAVTERDVAMAENIDS